jgi:hypothetical protein
MNLTSQVCTTLRQSERLIKLGVKKETADCNMMLTIKGYQYRSGFDMEVYLEQDKILGNYQPAWSLHRLLCMLSPDHIALLTLKILGKFIYRPEKMYREVINIIEQLIKSGDFPKEYLEE